MSIVMGLDQHRAQITAEWLDAVTGEVSSGRIVPAGRAALPAGRRLFVPQKPVALSTPAEAAGSPGESRTSVARDRGFRVSSSTALKATPRNALLLPRDVALRRA